MAWYLRTALRVKHERQDTPYFLAALQVLTLFQEECNLWKHQLLSAVAARREQHMLHMLEELWKSTEQHVLVLKKQLSLHLHCDGSATLHLIFSSSSVQAWWDLGVLELPPHRFSAECEPSTAFWIKVNIQVINSHSSYPWRLLIPKDCSGKGADEVVLGPTDLNKGLGLSQFTLDFWWNWEYLLLQTPAACHMRLYNVQLGHSGTPSDALYIFALTDLKGQSMESMVMNMGQQKRNVLSLSTGTCCRRRLQKQMLWMGIKTWTV